jgi:hypothetical protein
MDLDTAYLESAMPEPVILLHQELKDYSLGHEMLLRRHESPFVKADRMPEIEDLYMAVFICACTFEEAKAELAKLAVNSTEFDERLAKWEKLVVDGNGGPLNEGQVLELILDFQKYVRDGSQCPKFNPISDGGPRKKPGAPLLALILRCLCREYHFTQTEAMNTPYGWALWLFCTNAEQERRIRIVTQADEDMDAIMRAEMKRRGLEPLIVRTKEEAAPPHPDEQSTVTGEIGSEVGGA